MTDPHTITFTTLDALLYSFLGALVLASFLRLTYNFGKEEAEQIKRSHWKTLLDNEEGAHELTRARYLRFSSAVAEAATKIDAIATDELNREHRTYLGAAAALKKIRDIAEAM